MLLNKEISFAQASAISLRLMKSLDVYMPHKDLIGKVSDVLARLASLEDWKRQAACQFIADELK